MLWKSLDVAEKEKFKEIFGGVGGITGSEEEEEEAREAQLQGSVVAWRQFLLSKGKLEQYS